MNTIDRLAAPESLLGMLQRGRGEGYLAALDAPRETVWAFLMECITNDPRLDSQCEDRAEYYAALALATGMDLAPIYSQIKHMDESQEDLVLRPPLPRETVMAAAERGSGDAVQMLREYVSWGWDWPGVILLLSRLGDEAALDGMDESAYRRIAADPAMRAAFKERVEEDWERYCGYDAEERRSRDGLMLPVSEPWKTLCERNSRLAGLFDEVGIAYDQPPPPKEKLTDAYAASHSVAEMFTLVDDSNRGPFWRVLPDVVSPQDEELLLENWASGDENRRVLAIRGLGKLGTCRAFEVVKTYIEGCEGDRSRVWHYALMAIAEIPGSLTLETARQWFRRKEWWFQVAGGHILERHATLEDVPLLIQALRTPETIRREDPRLASVLNALAHLEGIGPIPELEQIFCQAPSCFDRYRAAYAMAVTAFAQFRDHYAFECLWDCHWNTRVHGCETVDLAMPGALERLREIADDPCEDENVRQAAREAIEQT